jgi:hypothetical protein
MKKIEDLYFTVSITLSFARNFEQLHFFYHLLKIDTWNTYGILFSVEQMTFFCRAVEIPKKSVKQSRFEQMDFEQLTLTLLEDKILVLSVTFFPQTYDDVAFFSLYRNC